PRGGPRRARAAAARAGPVAAPGLRVVVAGRAGGEHRVAVVGREGGRPGRAGRHRGEVAVGVGPHDRQHQVDVLLAVVVAVDRGLLAVGGGQVLVAGAEVDRGGQRRVVDVLRVALAVAVPVASRARTR